jgi:hypothetical protein
LALKSPPRVLSWLRVARRPALCTDSAPEWPVWLRSAGQSRAAVGRGVGDCPVVKKAQFEVVNEKHKFVGIVNYCLVDYLRTRALFYKKARACGLPAMGRLWAGCCARPLPRVPLRPAGPEWLPLALFQFLSAFLICLGNKLVNPI